MKKQLLGDFPVSYTPFANIAELIAGLHTAEFSRLSERKKFRKVNTVLLEAIQAAQEPCFLLPAVLDFIERVRQKKLLGDEYHLLSFEFWLNQFSELPEEENLRVRAKIVGKYLPRGDYQAFFPIGMGKTFSGTHFVIAHMSPDIDTTIASFWGWIDAFAAKVADGLHQWCLPGTVADSHITYFFQELFSPAVFDLVARRVPTITMTAFDLVTQRDIVKVSEETPLSRIDHNHAGKPMILIDEKGHFKGDWRAQDAEAVRQILMLFNSGIRWFENTVHHKLILALAKKVVHLEDIEKTVDAICGLTVKASDPFRELTEKQKRYQNDFFEKILRVPNGPQSTFTELISMLDEVAGSRFSVFQEALNALSDPALFDADRRLIENRPKLFSRLEDIIKSLGEAIQSVRNHVDRLGVLLEIKEKVLGLSPTFISLRSDVEELHNKIDNLDHLTVVIPEEDGKWFPVGVVYATDLRKSVLGTVSFRDFCNFEETKIASYLEVISVIDHHKTEIKTVNTPTMIVADAQSSNTLVAETTMELNRKYSTLGMSRETIGALLAKAHGTSDDPAHLASLRRLLQIKINATNRHPFFIDTKREFIEYLAFITAILDDTDLLSKVSDRDVECVAALLNRMKSITTGSDAQIISLDNIPRGDTFATLAAARILKNDDMYSIYKKIYEFREREVEANLAACVAERPSIIFADTKEQNGCARVGQTKLFCTNWPLFHTYATELRRVWLKTALAAYEAKNQIDFHLHMISTIPGADEVYSGSAGDYPHKDEIWFWIPQTTKAAERLVSFLSGFSSTKIAQNEPMEVEFLGTNRAQLEPIFAQYFPQARRQAQGKPDESLPIAVLHFPAGCINSRKAMITPYLPRYMP